MPKSINNLTTISCNRTTYINILLHESLQWTPTNRGQIVPSAFPSHIIRAINLHMRHEARQCDTLPYIGQTFLRTINQSHIWLFRELGNIKINAINLQAHYVTHTNQLTNTTLARLGNIKVNARNTQDHSPINQLTKLSKLVNARDPQTHYISATNQLTNTALSRLICFIMTSSVSRLIDKWRQWTVSSQSSYR